MFQQKRVPISNKWQRIFVRKISRSWCENVVFTRRNSLSGYPPLCLKDFCVSQNSLLTGTFLAAFLCGGKTKAWSQTKAERFARETTLTLFRICFWIFFCLGAFVEYTMEQKPISPLPESAPKKMKNIPKLTVEEIQQIKADTKCKLQFD